jgi:hypothetical protein
MIRRLLHGAVIATAMAAAAPAETVRCPAVRDVWLSNANDREMKCNMGGAGRIKLKVWQEFCLVDFDVSALKGKAIEEAYLVVKPVGRAKLGLNGGSDLRWLTVSTVSHEWVEGKNRAYAPPKAGGATFLEWSGGKGGWGWKGAKVYDVTLGNGNTLRCDGRLKPHDGRLRMKLDADLVRALAVGAGHGLLLMDGSTYVGVNSYIASREAGAGPYLEVKVSSAVPAAAVGPAPEDLTVEPAPNWATPELGAAMVSLKVPAGAFAYGVEVNGKPVDRWQVPFAARAGTVQTFPLLDLPPKAELKVTVAAVSVSGESSAVATAVGRASEKLTVPDLPSFPFRPAGGPPAELAGAKVWAFPEVMKIHPVNGQVFHEKVPGDVRRANAVWDGATDTIRLAAARGEIVSFQLAVEGEVKGCRLAVSDLAGPGEVAADGVRLWRNWYVKGHPEYAIPLEGPFDCPMADNEVAGQTLQAVTVDYHIPPGTPAGDYTGTVTLSAGRSAVELPLKVKVYDAVLPDEVFFNPELNCYGGPGRAGSEKFKDSFRLAHYHRCTINRVPYSQNGRVHKDWTPEVADDGRVTDWATFDANLGGLLDGSWFEDNPRAGVPVPTLYLPLFEGWPKDYRKHYRPGKGVPLKPRDDVAKLRHDILAPPIDEAMDEAFEAAFIRCTADFVAHARARGWNRTLFQCYLNNKKRYGYAMWTLDEPFEYLDWAALNYFGRLYKRGVGDPAVHDRSFLRSLCTRGLAALDRDRPTFLYRGDVSRPNWQGSVSDGVMNIMYVGGTLPRMPRLLRFHKERMPTILYAYGQANRFGRSNWESAAWCLETFCHNGDGVLPWQSLGPAKSLKVGDRPGKGNALIIDTGEPFGHAVGSLRLHALRRGAQDCELLRLLQRKDGWSREHCGLLVARKVPLAGRFRQAFTDEAAATTYGSLTSRGMIEMKEGVLILLTRGR